MKSNGSNTSVLLLICLVAIAGEGYFLNKLYHDNAELRARERFIGRWIVRKKAEGFNYTAAAPPFNPAEEGRHFSQQRNQSRSQRSPQPGSQHRPERSGQRHWRR